MVMTSCSDFLEHYSDLRDDLLDATTRARLVEHMDICPTCARYDRVVSDGVGMLLDVQEIAPSEDFVHRLDTRLALADELLDTRPASGAPVGFVMAVAVAIVAVAWLPALRTGRDPVMLPAAQAHAPYHPPTNVVAYQPDLLGVGRTENSQSWQYSSFSSYSLLGGQTRPRRPQFVAVGR